MGFIITDGAKFIKENEKGDPVKVNGIALATEFSTAIEANTYLLSSQMKRINSDMKNKFRIEPVEGELHIKSSKIDKEIEEQIAKEIKELDGVYEDYNDIKYSDEDNKHVYSGKTPMEDDDFDLGEFLLKAVEVFSNLNKFAENMAYMEREMDLNINDLRHFERDDNTRLNAIQMQNLGYCRQEMERMRKRYKSNKILSSIFVNDINRVKNENYIKVIKRVIGSEYKFRRLSKDDINNMIKTNSVNLKIVS
jgi:hypothetical protein